MKEKNNNSVIRKNDDTFKDLNFENLRKAGIEHISELSGKIWTDHNLHDPGITTLEILCYALMDLGYRSLLPVENLLALKPGHQEDNFFTPAEILTNNPLTIIDYQKLLLSIEGIRYAWLEMAGESEQPLYVTCNYRQDDDVTNYNPSGQRAFLSCDARDNSHPLLLNGLYRVYLVIDTPAPQCPGTEDIAGYRKEILEKVRQTLQEYRNLSEDFIDINVLCEEKISFCGNIIIDAEADPEAVYTSILNILNQFLNPELSFYTLDQMLEKGKSMEEIFAGRPFLTSGPGFIDTEELKQLKPAKEIHLSDVYKLIGKIEGVLEVKDIRLKATIEGTQHVSQSACEGWVHHLAPDHWPVLDVKSSCFEISSQNTTIQLNIAALNKKFLEQKPCSGNLYQRFPYLDHEIPRGNYLSDLNQYSSVQNDFPLVYGIGEGGLPKDASYTRKAQAFQFKGFLLFFDQLLANYLAQMTNIRELFSMTPDSQSAINQTVFSQKLETVPQAESLIRFYETNDLLSDGSTLAIPVNYNFSDESSHEEALLQPVALQSQAERDVIVNRLVTEFQEGEYNYRIMEETCGYYFIFSTIVQNLDLVSKLLYPDYNTAKSAADSFRFLAVNAESYQQVNLADQGKYSFEIIFKGLDYLNIMQQSLENEEKYFRRRNKFLDHLLARFAEDFTDKAVTGYLAQKSKTDQLALINQKAIYLKNYPEISRDRYRAYNYHLNGWNTTNISGFEKKIAALNGNSKPMRKNLCHFEIAEYAEEFMISLPDFQDDILLVSNAIYSSSKDARNDASEMIKNLKKGNGWFEEDGYHQYRIHFGHKNISLTHPYAFHSRENRDQYLQVMRQAFATQPLEESARPSAYTHYLELHDHKDNMIVQSRKKYDQPEKALQDTGSFIKNIKKQQVKQKKQIQTAVFQSHRSEENIFFNVAALKKNLLKEPPKYRWTIKIDNRNAIESIQAYQDIYHACEGFAQMLALPADQIRFQEVQKINESELKMVRSAGSTLATGMFSSAKASEAAQQKIKKLLTGEREIDKIFTTYKKGWRWQVLDDDGNLILQSKYLFEYKRMAEKSWRDLQKTKSLDKSLRVEKNQKSYRLEIKQKDNRAMAYSPWLNASKMPEEEIRERLLKAITSKKNMTIIQVEEVFGFRIPEEGQTGQYTLVSYRLFESLSEALFELILLFQQPPKKNQYFLTGDEANLNYSFTIKDQLNQFIAYHPQSYSDQEEREKAIKKTEQVLDKGDLPFEIIPKLQFSLVNNDGERLLNSAGEYRSEKLMEKALVNLASVASVRACFKKFEKNDRYGFDLKDGQQLLAWFPRMVDREEEADNVIEETIAIVNAATYQVNPVQYPLKWVYYSDWIRNNRQTSEFFRSKAEYDSKKAALEAYQDIYPQVGSLNIKSSGKSFSIARGEEVLAEHHDTYKDKGTLEVVMKEARQYLATLKSYRSLSPQRAQSLVTKTPQSEQGNFVYRVLNKDEIMATHPCNCFQEKQEAQRMLEELRKRMKSGYQYLEICLKGPIVIKVDDLYHYVLKDKDSGLVYFISYQGYDTEEEARQGFAENYLIIIDLASDKDNYTDWLVVCEDKMPDKEKCRKPFPIACIPRETFLELGIDRLATLFCSYPIRIKNTITDSCQQTSDTCYYFHLLGPNGSNDRDCKEDWVSKKCYDTIEEASQVFRLFLELLQNEVNYFLYQDPDCCCFYVAIREISLESSKRYSTQELAWQGLDQLLAVSCDPNSWMTREEFCCYSFLVADQPFAMAHHPHQYPTPLKRDEAVKKLFAACQCKPDQQLDIRKVISEQENSWHFEIHEVSSKRILWKGVNEYPTESEAFAAALEAINYARYESFYHSKNADTIHLTSRNRSICMDSNEGILAEHHSGEGIDALVKLANNYPYVFRNGLYGYQVYCDELEVTETHQEFDADCKTYNTVISKKRGDIAWQSIQEYQSFDEMQEAYTRFCRLLNDQKNYRPKDRSDCGPYSLMITDPDHLLAFHPQCYSKIADREKAEERAKSLLNDDGMHLVEHILLRPKQEEDCHCLPPVNPLCDCELTYDPFDQDPCHDYVPDFSRTYKSTCVEQVEENPCRPRGDEEVPSTEQAPEYLYIPFSDPYSFWVTLVFPCWTKQSRQQAYREAMQKMLMREAPAHLGIRIFWLDPQQMCEFDEIYKNWIRHKAGLRVCDDVNFHCELTRILYQLRDCPPEDIQENRSCDCDPARLISTSQMAIKYLFHSIENKPVNYSLLHALNSHEVFLSAGRLAELASFDHIIEAPPAVFKDQPIPDVMDEIPEATIINFLRKRKAGYKEMLAEADESFKENEAYKRTEHFLNSQATDQLFNDIIEVSMQRIRQSSKKETIEKYLNVLRISLSNYLDQQVIRNKTEIEPGAREILKKLKAELKSEKIQMKSIAETWSGKELQDQLKAPVIAKYNKMLV